MATTKYYYWKDKTHTFRTEQSFVEEYEGLKSATKAEYDAEWGGLSLFGRWYHKQAANWFHPSYSGSFMTSLRECFFNADPTNRAKLVLGFPEYFNENDITLKR